MTRYPVPTRRGVRVGLRSATGNRVPAERWVAGSNPALSASTGETRFPPWAPSLGSRDFARCGFARQSRAAPKPDPRAADDHTPHTFTVVTLGPRREVSGSK